MEKERKKERKKAELHALRCGCRPVMTGRVTTYPLRHDDDDVAAREEEEEVRRRRRRTAIHRHQ